MLNYLSYEPHHFLRLLFHNNKYFSLKLWEMVNNMKRYARRLYIFENLKKNIIKRERKPGETDITPMVSN